MILVWHPPIKPNWSEISRIDKLWQKARPLRSKALGFLAKFAHSEAAVLLVMHETPAGYRAGRVVKMDGGKFR